METPVATKLPWPAFEMEKPPPFETVVSVRRNGPNDVIIGTLEKSPNPAPEVSELIPVTVVAARRLRLFSVTETPANGMDSLICMDSLSSFAGRRVVHTVIVEELYHESPSL
jgi:hypothetical protein